MTTEHELDYSWEDSFPYLLWRAHNAVHRRVTAATKGIGVTVTQLGLAVHLFRLGELSASDLARGIHVTPQSVASALTRLEDLGWVTRAPHPVHGRVVLFTLTEAGIAGVHEGTVLMAEVSAEVTALMGDGPEPVAAELRRILRGLEGSDQPMAALWPVRA